MDVQKGLDGTDGGVESARLQIAHFARERLPSPNDTVEFALTEGPAPLTTCVSPKKHAALAHPDIKIRIRVECAHE